MLRPADLQALRAAMRSRVAALGPAPARRGHLAAAGTLRRVEPALPAWRHWAAADGSWVSFGTPYPYIVEVYRGLALSTRGERALEQDLFCPLRPEDAVRFEATGGDGAGDLNRIRGHLMSGLELKAAAALVQATRPDLLLLDGGLLTFEDKAPAEWRDLCRAADAAGALLAGVIEDIATHALAPLAGLEGFIYDREVLHGVLHPGEAFLPDPETGVKSGRCATAFVRWGSEPRPIGVDVRRKDEDRLPALLDALAATVPAQGRGIPLWLDVVDRDVRLHNQDVERWLQVGLGELYETLVVPHRLRRPY